MDRSLVRFYAGIKSDVTRKTYESDLKRFLSFVKIKDAGGLAVKGLVSTRTRRRLFHIFEK